MPPHVNWLATVYHGLPASVCPFYPSGGDYLAFLGRISPEKRPDRAIEIAKRAGVPLKIAAKVDKADQDYFEEVIRPLLDHPLVEFIGEVNEAREEQLSWECPRSSVPNRLAGAVWAGHDRGDVGRDPGHCVASWLRLRGDRGRDVRDYRRLDRPGRLSGGSHSGT